MIFKRELYEVNSSLMLRCMRACMCVCVCAHVMTYWAYVHLGLILLGLVSGPSNVFHGFETVVVQFVKINDYLIGPNKTVIEILTAVIGTC